MLMRTKVSASQGTWLSADWARVILYVGTWDQNEADLTIMLQLILVWTPGKESPVHDHAGSHCVMKVLQGSLKETRYRWPERKVMEDHQHSPLQIQESTLLSQDEVTYISDNVSHVLCEDSDDTG